ncbi:MAG: HEAT repeat domain-containing protein [Polyangiaceae bacterium]
MRPEARRASRSARKWLGLRGVGALLCVAGCSSGGSADPPPDLAQAALHDDKAGGDLTCESTEAPRAGDPAREDAPLLTLPDLPEAPAPELGAQTLVDTATYPFLDGEPELAVSIGDTSNGRVAAGRALEESDSVQILPKQRLRDLRYGSDGLITMLEEAGRVLYQRTHTPLWLGNIGKRDGGDIEWSVSHNAGRDADVAFSYRDAATHQPVDPPDLVALGSNGVSADGKYELDVARTWIVVRAMVESKATNLQFLFISDPLRKKLLDYAKSAHEPGWVIERASDVLKQPYGSAPHDDHLHVRVYCSRLDVACGCVDTGVIQPFAPRFDGEREKAARKARSFLSDSSPDRRRRALLRLSLVGGAEDVAVALARLEDSTPEVRVAAAQLVASLGDERHVARLIHRFREETDPTVLAALLESIALLGGSDSGPFLRDLLLASAAAAPTCESPFEPLPPRAPIDTPSEYRALFAPWPSPDVLLDRVGVGRLVVEVARYSDRLEIVEPLVALLDPANPELAGEAARSLAYVTNHALAPWGADLEAPLAKPLDQRLAESRERYMKLLPGLGSARRDGWLINGFSTKGYRISSLDRRAAWELVRAISDAEHISYNARKALAKILGERPDAVHFGVGDACKHFYRELEERRSSLRLDRPNQAQQAACGKARGKDKTRKSIIRITPAAPTEDDH